MAIGITKEACIASLRVKLLAFAELYTQRNPSGTFSAAVRAHAELASTSTNLTFLRRFSAEADVVLRETLESEELVKFAEELSKRGVNDLPRRPPKVPHLWPPKLLHPGRSDLTH